MSTKTRAILPRGIPRLGSDRYRRQIEAALDRVARATVEDYRAVVRTWSDRPEPRVTATAFERTVTIDDERFLFVDEGTRPHLIRPKRPGGLLRFGTGYQAKTQPGVLRSSPGGFSGPVVFARVVRHPGTKARLFTQRIQAEAQLRLARAMQDAVEID